MTQDFFRPVYIADIQLKPSHPLPELASVGAYGSAFGIVWLHGTPVASIEIPLRDGVCSATRLADAIVESAGRQVLLHLLADALVRGCAGRVSVMDLVAVPHSSSPGPLPSVTVAVPTRNRPEELRRCLDSLAKVEYPSFEVLVIDNAPSDGRVREMMHATHPTFRYEHEPRPGLNWARNRAIAEARGDIVAFTDDDVVVDPGWINAIATVMAENPDVATVTGLVLPQELETEPQLLFERHGGFGRGFNRRWVRTAHGEGAAAYANTGLWGTGANMAFRRAAFEDVGLFDPALDAGTRTEGGGDLDMFFRVLKAGHTLVYEPAAVVRHRHRRTYRELRAQLSSWGVGMQSYLVRSMRAFPDERQGLVGLSARLLLLHFPRRLLQSFGGTIRAQLVIDQFRGALAAFRRYPAARRDAAGIDARFGFPCPSRGSSSTHTIPAAGTLRPIRSVSLDIDDPLPSVLPGPNDSDRIHVHVLKRGQPLVTVDLVCGGAPVSGSRLADALAIALSPILVNMQSFTAELRTWLGGYDLPPETSASTTSRQRM